MATSNGHSANKLSADNIDDLIYACRANELDDLRTTIAQWAVELNTSEADLIASAIDMDDEGMGSRACLLHYPAANGNLDMVKYILDTLQSQKSASASTNGDSNRSQNPTRLVNHTNVSGNTPLHWAALNGHIEVVKALFLAGADPTIVNGAGRDVVVEAEYSSIESAAECATWLLQECEALETGTGTVDATEEMQTADEQSSSTVDQSGDSTSHLKSDGAV